MSGKFTLRQVVEQVETMNQLGSFDKIKNMIPGFGGIKLKDTEKLNEAQERTRRWKHAINSMTQEEIENPEILEKQTNRIRRIAQGSGCSTSDVRMLIKQWKMLNEMI